MKYNAIEISEKRKEYLSLIGLDPKDSTKWTKKLQSLRQKAKSKGVSCLLSFEEYVDLAISAGISQPEDIGCKPDLYQMGRIGDVGDYIVGNCRFITMRQNLLEREENGGRQREIEKKIGRNKHNHEGMKTISIKRSKRYVLYSPTGDKYEGLNLSEFCHENGLSQQSMSAVCSGKQRQHKGWTGYYIEREQ